VVKPPEGMSGSVASRACGRIRKDITSRKTLRDLPEDAGKT